MVSGGNLQGNFVRPAATDKVESTGEETTWSRQLRSRSFEQLFSPNDANSVDQEPEESESEASAPKSGSSFEDELEESGSEASAPSEAEDGDDSNRPSGQRVIPQVLDDPVAVPALKEFHDSWTDFFNYLDEYTKATHQVIRKSVTLTVKARNEAIGKTKAAKAGLDVRYLPTSWKVYRRIFICTHGWEQRSRGQGKRPARFIRSVDCPFKFSVYMVYFDKEKKWRLAVHGAYLFHNHAISREVFRTYAENRGVENPDNQAKAQNMIENQRKRKVIYTELLTKGENVVMKDVENMIYAYKTEVKREDDDVECLAKLTEFTAADERNFASMDETSQKETGVISITSRFMAETAERFFEILLVDSSHKTNRYNYQLLTLMAINDDGQGQAVQHSLLERNADWHMSRALEHFVRVNPGIAEKVEVLMVDKDLNEIRILKSFFPRARVLGVFSRTQIEAMRALYSLKVYCKDGDAICKWLRQDVPQSLFKISSREVAEEIEPNYPNKRLAGLKDDCTFEALYRVLPNRWISDAFIGAVCERATKDFRQLRYLGIATRKPKRARGRKEDLEDEIKDRLSSAALDQSAEVLALPVNVGNTHWTVILVMLKRREILYYDSMGANTTVNALKDVAGDIQENLIDVLGSPAFGLVCVNSPRQFDGHSCGVFVCLKIIRTLDKTISNDVSPSGVTNLGYRLLVYALRGHDA